MLFQLFLFLLYVNVTEQSSARKDASISNDIQKAFESQRAENGLIPRIMGPSEVLTRKLNAVTDSDAAPENVASNCGLIGTTQHFTLGSDLNIYAEDSWQPSNAGDVTTVCVYDNTSEEITSIPIYREGETMGNHSIASLNNNAEMNGSGLSETEAGTDSEISDGGTSTSPIVPVGHKTITPVFKSAYDTSVSLTPKNYSINVSCSDGSSQSFSGPASVADNVSCDFTATSANSGNLKIVYGLTSAHATLTNTGSTSNVIIPLEDTYQTGVTLTYEANPKKTPVHYQIGTLENDIDLNSKVLTLMLPRGTKQVSVTGTDITPLNKTLAVTSPKDTAYIVETKSKINILSTVAWWVATSVNRNENMGGLSDTTNYLSNLYYDIYGKYDLSSVLADKTHKALIAFGQQFIGSMIQQNMHLNVSIFGQTKNLNVFSTYMGAGLENNATGEKTFNQAQLINQTTLFKASNGQDYYVNNKTGEIYRRGVTNWTPVKISLDETHAMLNSDDYFLFDPDGFTQKTVKVVTTPGGLNAREAWLVIDRHNNGTWINNTLDNDDVFGDHMGRQKNGYEDLIHTFGHELQTDAKGNKYISLENDGLWDILKIKISRFFGDKVPYAVTDLNLLERDHSITPAKNMLRRIYVNYWNVDEFDKAHLNAIHQRAWLMFNDGRFAQSADQYWAFTDGVVEKLNKEDSAKVYQEYLNAQKKK